MMALEAKDMSEREELLSDVNNFDDVDAYQMQSIHEQNAVDDDPLVEAAMAKHIQKEKESKDEEEVALEDDDLNLERNTFCIAQQYTDIKCGISWSFVDENKMIDLDLIVTALDIWSFEMESVNKDHKKMFKKCVVYTKNKKNKDNKDDKCVALKLGEIPENCHSLWFRINAYSGDSLKDVDSASFRIYEDEEQQEEQEQPVLYSYDIGMGFDCGAMLLGVLYRSASNSNEWQWTIVEEKNLYSNLINNNLNLIYDDDVLLERPNDENVQYALTKTKERYIIDPSLHCVSIGIGWELTHSAHDIDIDVDASVMVFGKMEKAENDKGVEEDDCDEIDIVNNNNNLYKTYVEYRHIDKHKHKGKNKENEKEKLKQDDDDDEDDNELGMVEQDDDDDDDEVFDVYISKMNGDNDVGSLCVLLNIFNDNNLANKNKTNNITNCYVRLFGGHNGNEELCRYTLSNVNDDKKTCALVLLYFRKLKNNCWCIITNDVPLKSTSSLSYQQYAKQIVLAKYSHKNKLIKESCCLIL